MNIEEIINDCRNQNTEAQIHCNECKQQYDDETSEMIDRNNLIIKSLEKQIPMKIKIYDYGKAHCPVCDRDIHGIGKIKFCFACGQKLEWK